jgi:hypothetical protein
MRPEFREHAERWMSAPRRVPSEQLGSPKFLFQVFDAVLPRDLPKTFPPSPQRMNDPKRFPIPPGVPHEQPRVSGDLTAEHAVGTLLALRRLSGLRHPPDKGDRLHLKPESIERLLRSATPQDSGRDVEGIKRTEEQAGQLNLESHGRRCLPTRVVGEGPDLRVPLASPVKELRPRREDRLEKLLIGQF